MNAKRVAIAAIGGAVMGLATPPIDFYLAAFLGEIALAFALFGEDEAPPSKRAWLAGALRGWVFGAAVNVFVLRFVPATITRFTDLPWALGALALLLLAMFQGVRWLAAGWLTRQLVVRRVPGFLAFGIAVWASTFVPTVFDWTVAAGISPVRPLVQMADIVGERGVSALIAVACGLLAEAIRALRAGDRRRSVQLAIIGAAVPALMAAGGALRIRFVQAARARAEKVRVALAQPQTEARMRWDPREADSIVRRLAMITIAAEQRGTDLVVWPEAAFPYPISATARVDRMGIYAILQPGVHGPVLTGLEMRARGPGGGVYNSATIAHGGRLEPPYHKMHLLAFGEYVPFSRTFPALRRAFVRGTGMVPGDHQIALTTGKIRAAVLNCFEDTLPEAGLEAIDVNPNLLVNVTNDAWFVHTEESELHLRLATMRAIELRRDLVRAVNEGETSWVDATGLVRARYDLPVPGTLPTRPALLEGKTIYARLGDLAGLILLGLLGAATWLGRQKQNGAP